MILVLAIAVGFALMSASKGNGSRPELSWPIAAPRRITSRYGYRTDPITGAPKAFHMGLDFGASKGTPVLAASAGVVTSSRTSPSYGERIELTHAAIGLKTTYSHLETRLVQNNQTIKAGDVIGLVGTTGKSTGPHLHFEVMKGIDGVNGFGIPPGPFVDPEDYLPKSNV